MSQIAIDRLYHQQLQHPTMKTPAELVSWLGAVQAQEYHGGKWALGLRLPDSVDADIERAIADKSITRISFMRGTLHFVPSADVRWMLPLFQEKIHRGVMGVSRQHKLGFDDSTFLKAKDILAKTLEGGKQLIRTEMNAALKAAGIESENLGYLLLIQRAQIDGLCCYGVNRGKQQTFTLLEEWLPPAKMLSRDEALAEMARRYFLSHGAATLPDYQWWTGLSAADAKAGLESIQSELISETIDGKVYWHSPTRARPPLVTPMAYLLPTYDEFLIAYKDRSASVRPEYIEKWTRGNTSFASTIVLDGAVIGMWKRDLKKKSVIITTDYYIDLNDSQREAIHAAAQRYADFHGLSLEI